VQRDGTALQAMLLDNAFDSEVQASGGCTNARSGGPGASFMPKLGGSRGAGVARRGRPVRDPCRGATE
jgi:hypothetical protein